MLYSKAKIYKIYNTIDDDIYIGSTCVSLSSRMSKHRAQMKMTKDKTNKCKLFQKMNEHGTEHFFIELIKEFPECESVEQLRKLEGEYITQLQPSLNHRVAGRSKQEYHEDNRETVNLKARLYRAQHKEQSREYEKWRREQHGDKLREKSKYYYNLNKDKTSQKVECSECGITVSSSSLKRHVKRKHS